MSRRDLEGVEAVHLGIVAGLLAVSCGGLALAEWGRYSLWAVATLALVLLGLAWAAGRDTLRGLRFPRTAEGILLLLVLAATAALAAPPHEVIFGDGEAGVLAAAAAHLSRSGHLTHVDPTTGGTLAGSPLLTVLLATSHGLAGLPGVLWTSALLAVLAAAGAALLARRLFDDRTAVWAAILLAVNPARIWFSRSPTAENLASTWLMAGLLWLIVALETGRRGVAILAGLSLGAVHLLWNDAAAVPLVLGLGLAERCVRQRLRSVHLWLAAGYLPLASYAAAHDAFPGAAGVVRALVSTEAQALRTALVAALLVGLAAAVGRRRLEGALAASGSPRVTATLAAAVLALGIHAYFVLPRAAEPAIGFASLGWYVDPLGLLLATLGFSAAVVRQRSTGFGPLLLLAFLETARYARDGHLVPDHFRAARPALVLVFPVLALFAAHMLVSLGKAIREEALESSAPPLIGLALALAGLASWLPFRSHVEQQGSIEHVGRLADLFPEEALVLFDDSAPGRRLALPLRLVWGRRSLIVRSPGADAAIGSLVAGRGAASRPVYWVKDRGAPAPTGAGCEGRRLVDRTIDVPEFARAVGQRPDHTGRLRLELTVFRCVQTRPSTSSQVGAS